MKFYVIETFCDEDESLIQQIAIYSDEFEAYAHLEEWRDTVAGSYDLDDEWWDGDYMPMWVREYDEGERLRVIKTYGDS